MVSTSMKQLLWSWCTLRSPDLVVNLSKMKGVKHLLQNVTVSISSTYKNVKLGHRSIQTYMREAAADARCSTLQVGTRNKLKSLLKNTQFVQVNTTSTNRWLRSLANWGYHPRPYPSFESFLARKMAEDGPSKYLLRNIIEIRMNKSV